MDLPIIDLQLLIMFYKNEAKDNPSCIANKALLKRSRNRLKEMRND